MARDELLLSTLVELADTLVGEYDVSDFLHQLTERAVDLLEVHSAGVVLAEAANPPRLSLIAASNHDARAVELFQMQRGQGPCQDAYVSGEQVVEEDLAGAATRWPEFAARAVEAGIRAVYAFPMRLREERIGALNLFRGERGAFKESDVVVAQALADVATIGILQERAVRDAHVRSEQLQHALESRVLIEQAKGVLAERLDIDLGEAFERMRAHARSNNRLLREVAGAVLEQQALPD